MSVEPTRMPVPPGYVVRPSDDGLGLEFFEDRRTPLLRRSWIAGRGWVIQRIVLDPFRHQWDRRYEVAEVEIRHGLWKSERRNREWVARGSTDTLLLVVATLARPRRLHVASEGHSHRWVDMVREAFQRHEHRRANPVLDANRPAITSPSVGQWFRSVNEAVRKEVRDRFDEELVKEKRNKWLTLPHPQPPGVDHEISPTILALAQLIAIQIKAPLFVEQVWITDPSD